MSEPRSEETVPSHSGVGETLRARREQLGWQIDDVASHLKMRPSVVEALEKDDYEKLPGKAYVLGFIRSYAAFLNLDAAPLVGSLNQGELKRAEKASIPAVTRFSPNGDRGVSVVLLVVVGIIIVIVAYVCWYRFANHTSVPSVATPAAVSEQKEDTSSVPNDKNDESRSRDESPTTPSGPTLPDVGSNTARDAGAGQTPDVTPEPEPSTHSGESGNAANMTLPTPAPLVGSNEASQPSPFEAPKQAQAHPETSPAPKVSSTLDPHQVVLRVTQDSWVQIKNAQGRVVQSRVMKKGESWVGDDQSAPYRITAGNAGGVLLQAGDAVSEPLGPSGTVKRNVSVTAQGVIDGHYGHGTLPDGMSVVPNDLQKDHSSTVPTLDHNAASH
ncbi:DUF4115 domain-containing protein [Saccharibacter sp. 17.LH.SD]|uniref:helix-turn-helix domain-containing protein n=1 Tax=Saccharibacter sp. 17.LH.SD TaxID=2689393 RepID=UPI00136BB26A|nr:helix-turn-helix domain-containing protein [Saccharibacter sp. 17.LH.SD]MXV44574.1 DUF4115 domain-containing protein [Saccharibacter sp. 17.LH.SD]